MLSPTGWWLAVAPVDLRCGVDRLLVQVSASLGREPTDGGAYVFRNRAGTRIKVLCVDAHGVWLCVRRLHAGRFHWPRVGEATCALSTCEQVRHRGTNRTTAKPQAQGEKFIRRELTGVSLRNC